MSNIQKTEPQNTVTAPDHIQRWMSLLHGAQTSIIALGDATAQCIDADPDFVETLTKRFPQVTAEFVRKCEMVGRKKLHPRLVISEGPGASRLRRMPLALQEKYVSEPLPLLIRCAESGTVDVINADLLNLTSDQAKQVFDCDAMEVRSEAAQRLWLENQSAKLMPTPKANNSPYRKVKDKIVVMVAGTAFSREELLKMALELE